MRIITGKARGVNLVTLAGENTRPTAERTKEAVFSMLQFELEGRRVLDLFAGSGQMALEALSRGAEFAVMVDSSKEAVRVIEKNVEKTKMKESCRVICSSAADYLKRQQDRFDIIWLDPPYDSNLIGESLSLLLKGGFVKPTTTIVCESRAEDVFEGNESLRECFTVRRKAKYGIAHVTLLTPNADIL
ncbi:MAG: 16S rRNA (guanine(966)-N(2))-methyltransferase RsmD [Ruminococcaceae bacterium]|nr:16S rRNA (guanine(966)-N(2))-methyltransferase RsmD [Oscillospiraceae bacterium]